MNATRWEHLRDVPHPAIYEAYKVIPDAEVSVEVFQRWLISHLTSDRIDALVELAHSASLRNTLTEAARQRGLLDRLVGQS
jgi:hypothetical protein